MSSDIGDVPEPRVDDEPERAPGGVDAVLSAESNVGAGADGAPVTPDEPMSAQQDDSSIPEELHEPERPEPEEQATDNTDAPTS